MVEQRTDDKTLKQSLLEVHKKLKQGKVALLYAVKQGEARLMYFEPHEEVISALEKVTGSSILSFDGVKADADENVKKIIEESGDEEVMSYKGKVFYVKKIKDFTKPFNPEDRAAYG